MLPVVKLIFIWILGILILPYVALSLAHIIGLTALCSILFLCLHFMPACIFMGSNFVSSTPQVQL